MSQEDEKNQITKSFSIYTLRPILSGQKTREELGGWGM